MKKGVKKVFFTIFIVLLVVSLSFLGYFGYKTYKNMTSKPGEVKIVDEIKAYGYVLEEDAPKGYKTMFKELSKVLAKEEVDEEEYAALVASMFAFDFYTLNNKVSKNDIGGVQFVLSSYKDNFILEASDSVYKYIEINLDGKRKQKLPEVTAVEVTNSEVRPYKFGKITDENSYIVSLKLTYAEDLKYPTEVTVKLVHQDKKLEVIYLK